MSYIWKKKIKIDIKNKNILITGSTGGIGKAITKVFDDESNKLLITGTKESKLMEFSKELKSKVEFVTCDLKDYKNIKLITKKIQEKLENKIDILINNAGMTKDNLTLRMKEDEW